MRTNPEQPLTPRQIASRENGAKSQGPVTEEGKQRSSLNSLRHGLCSSSETLMEGDSLEGFTALKLSLYEQYDPQTATEILLVEKIIACAWRLRRILTMETALFESDAENRFTELNLLSRYQTTIERSMNQTIKFLDQQRRQRLQATRVPHNPDESGWREVIKLSSEEAETIRKRIKPKPPLAPIEPATQRPTPETRKEGPGKERAA